MKGEELKRRLKAVAGKWVVTGYTAVWIILEIRGPLPGWRPPPTRFSRTQIPSPFQP
jgi:hypothetical protein